MLHRYKKLNDWHEYYNPATFPKISIAKMAMEMVRKIDLAFYENQMFNSELVFSISGVNNDEHMEM